MTDQYSFKNINSLNFQLAFQIQELSQKKNETNQQIRVCRANIAERNSWIETTHRDIKKLEEEIRVKHRSVIHNKENAKRLKASNGLLLQYEQTLKAELESRKDSYNHDMEDYEERIASYKKTFQLHQEYYFKNSLAKKLRMLQAEKEEIECRIKGCDDQITMKQKEMDHLTGPVVSSFSTEKLPESVPGQQPIAEEEKQLDCKTEVDSDSSIDMSSLHLDQTRILQNDQKTPEEANTEEIHEENMVQDSPTCCASPEKASKELWSCQQLDEPASQPDELHTEEQDQEMSQEDQVLEQQPTVSGVEKVLQVEVQERAASDEELEQSGDDEGLPIFPQTSSQETNPQSNPAKMTAVPSTPTFPFNFSPTGSPHQGTSDTKSPAFLFSLNSDPSTPGFSGFGFDEGSSLEDSSFAFTGSFFNDKKTTESKSSGCPEFLFGQPEQSGDFKFAFTSKSPQSANKESTKDDFPFSFNF